MLRQIIHIDEEKCNGCGLCAKACHLGRRPFLLERVDGPGEKVSNSRSFSMILPALVRIMRNLPLIQNLSPRAATLLKTSDYHSDHHS